MATVIGSGFCLLSCAAAAGQVSPDPGLRLSRGTYHPVVTTLTSTRGEVSDAELEQLRKLPLEAIWSGMRNAGYGDNYCSGLHTTRPGERLVGRALTIRYLPRRPDMVKALERLAKEGDWSPRFNVRAVEEAKPGDVVVVDLGGRFSDGVFFGDITALGLKTAGATGAVLWGATRDLMELRRLEGFPVLARHFDPRSSTQIGVDWNVPIRVDGATVLPGDVVVADDEAVLFFPPSVATAVIRHATDLADREEYERKLVLEKKHRFRDVYPMNEELRRKYEAERKKR